jgi:DNA-directed RNA polymerase specialized sigma24 family protein
MTVQPVPPTVARMDLEVLVEELMRHAPQVHGAAVAASRDPESAARVTERVFSDAARRHTPGQPIDRRLLIERAIRLAVRSCPAEGFAAMDERDREAIALARLGGYSVAEICRALEISPDEAKRRMSRGLRSVAAKISATPIQPALT